MLIFIKTYFGKNITLDTDPKDLISNVKKQIEEKGGIPSDRQRLKFEGKQLDDDKTLEFYSVRNNSTIHLTIGIPGGIEIFIHDFTGQNKRFEVHPTEKIKDLWTKIKEKIVATPSTCDLIYNGQHLKQENTIQDYCIPPHSVLHIAFKHEG